MNHLEWCITSHVVLPFSLSFPSDKYNTAITSAVTTRECIDNLWQENCLFFFKISASQYLQVISSKSISCFANYIWKLIANFLYCFEISRKTYLGMRSLHTWYKSEAFYLLRISSVSVTKFKENYGFHHIDLTIP